MRVWLDDERPMPQDYDLWVKDGDHCVELLKAGLVTHLSFDHDLDGRVDGYAVALFVEVMAEQAAMKPFTWDVHSANPPGRDRITAAMEAAERFWGR